MTERARRRIRLGLLLGLFLAVVVPVVLLLPGSSSQQSAQTRYVNNTDPSCGGLSPCYPTIQTAVTAAQAGDTVLIQAGTYREQVLVSGKNHVASATEASRIVIEADPHAPLGSVVLQGGVSHCTHGYAVRLQRSKFLTLRGLTITGAGGPAVVLRGSHHQNEAIHLERLRIFGNGNLRAREDEDDPDEARRCPGGIRIGEGNPHTVIVNSLIYANGGDGVTFAGEHGGPHSLVGNTVHGNEQDGVKVGGEHTVFLVNNVITDNGTAPAARHHAFGLSHQGSPHGGAKRLHLLHNLLCGNRAGEIHGPALDWTDAGNLTPTGTEGPGVSASPGCDLPGAVYANVSGPDGLPNTADDDFALATTSPAIDRGLDPRTLGLDPSFTPLLEADFTGEGVRPKDGTGSGTAEFDIGAFEFKLDVTAPGVTFQQPPAGAFVRQTVTVEAQGTDAGSGVQTFTLSADSQSLTASLSPSPPAATLTATGSWSTLGFTDGTHTLTATATDVAGNPASATRTVLVDNTPPDTQITGGPSGVIGEAGGTFTFTGTDNLTPVGNLLFAWNLDGGPFTTFSSATSADFTNLSEGMHTFQVKARDLAGNEDPSPASQSFTVTFGPLISSVDPPSGSIGTFVTITGTRLNPGPTQVAFNGVPAVVRTATPTTVTTTVPIGATTGSLTVATAQGTGSRAFTVTTTGDFTLTVAPASVPAVQGTSVEVRVDSPGSGTYAGLITLGTGPLPPGVTGTFSVPTLAPNGTAILTLSTSSTTPLGPSAITVTGTATLDGRTVPRSASTTLTIQAPGQTMLAGQVRDQDDLPLAGVRISLGGATLTPLGTTDAGGNFLVPLSLTGPQIILIDGSALNTPSAFYPTVPVTVTIQAGVVNTPGYLPKLRAIPATKLTPIPPGQPAVVTDPEIPGFTMTIPAGVQIIGWDGQPNTQVGVTVIPMDRSPLPPPPPSVTARFHYLFNFGKVGGGTPTGPVVIDPPNDVGALPGDQVELWYFNEAPDGTAPNVWQRYGTGTVSEDGARILTDVNPATGQRYGIPRFCCGGMMINVPPPPTVVAGGGPPGGPTGGGQKVSEPVDAATGFFYEEKTDLVLPARIPLVVRRTYRTGLTTQGPFGLGTSSPYDVFLQPPSSQSLMLFTPGNRQDLFARQADGGFINSTSPALRGAVVTTSPTGRSLRYKDGARWEFDLNGRLISQADRNGNTVTITRDSQGRVTTLTSPDGRALTLSYTGTNLRADSVTDPLFRQVRYTYDAQGRLETVTDPAGGVTRYTYDASHRILTITDPRGITYLTNQYDGSGRVIRQTQADGGVWTLAYQLQGRAVAATTVTDPRGNATIYRFNPAGYLVSQTDALGQTTTFQREPGTNLLLSTTDPLGRTTHFTYDAQGNVTTITDPAGNPRTFTYEPTFNRVTSITDPLGNVSRFEYDLAGNLTAIEDPLGARTTIAYNAFGQPVSTTDPLQNPTTFDYDSAGNLILIADPLGNITRRTYDAVSRLITQTDPRGYPTRFAYDALNRLTQIADPLASLTRFAYDGNGNLVTVTDARGNAVSHTYDPLDRLATRVDPLGATEFFEYDAVCNLIRYTDRKGQVTTFTYDALNRRTGAAYVDGSTTGFSYDAVGRLIQASDSAGGTILNAYDVMSRLLAQSTAFGTITYQYDALGRRTRMDVPGQASVFYGYDAAGRLRTISQAPLNSVIIDYDARGRRTLLTLPNGVSTEYQYDVASRLTALIYRNALGMFGDLTYQYDTAGNRVRIGGSFARSLMPDPVSSATYDAANRQLQLGQQVITYDPNGNLTSIADPHGASVLTWDSRNRLVSLVKGGIVTFFGYDVLGRRIAKTAGETAIGFIYDGREVVQELGDGDPVWYLRALAIDEPLVRSGGEFYLADAINSTVALTDATGAITTTYSYDPFGRTATSGAASGNRIQFTRRENDDEDLYFYRARYYSPRLTRFVQEDPAKFRGGLNFYAYARNNPVLLNDPLGLESRVPAGFNECHEQLGECARKAVERDLQCSTSVATFTISCELGAAAACVFAGPAGFGPCLAAFSTACIAAGGTLLTVCQGILAGELVLCLQEFQGCQKKGPRPLPPPYVPFPP